MKPKGTSEHEEGFLEYLEDIIGTVRLVEPIQQAELQFQQATEVCNSLAQQRRFAQRELDELIPGRDAALQFSRDENALAMAKSEIAHVERFRARKEAQKAQQEIEAFQLKLAEMHEQHSAETGQLQEMEREVGGLQGTLRKAEEQVTQAAKHLSFLERQDIQLRTRRDDLNTRQAKVQRLHRDEAKAKADAQREAVDLTARIESCQAGISQGKLQLEAAEAELEIIGAAVKTNTAGLQARLEAITKDLHPFVSKERAEQEALKLDQTALSLLESNATASDKDLAQVSQEITACELELQSVKEQVSNGNLQHRQLTQELLHVDTQIKVLQNIF